MRHYPQGIALRHYGAVKVLLLADHLDRAEARLFADLARRGHTLRCLTHPQAARRTALSEAGAAVDDLVCRSRIDFAAIRKIRTAVRSGSFDLVHSLTARTLSNAIIATAGITVPQVTYRGTVGHLARWSPASRISFLNGKISRIICVSEAVRRYLLGLGVDPDRAVTIHKGHDLDWYASPPADRETLSIPPGAFVVGCTANARPVKGVDLLIDAAARIMRGVPEMHLLLVGEMRDSAVAKAIKRHPYAARIHCTGYRADAPALMGACDIFVMPSRAREGLPKAAIEAMAQSVAPVVSDAGGLTELVIDGECGWVFPAGDAAALGDAIQAAYADPARRRAFGIAACERIRTAFNIERTVELTEKAWREAAA
jgi:glycosyltransferase involved in cell wall biosynthesis